MTLNAKLKHLQKEMVSELKNSADEIDRIRLKWKDERQQPVESAHEEILRDLQKEKIDGGEFIRLRRQIEQLRPLKEKQEILLKEQKQREDQRRTLLAEWGDLKRDDTRVFKRPPTK